MDGENRDHRADERSKWDDPPDSDPPGGAKFPRRGSRDELRVL